MTSYTGTAHIAVIYYSDSSALLGHFIVDPSDSFPQRVALGLSGEDITDQIVKGCSCEADDKWFKFTLTYFKEDKEVEFSVRMTGGDYCSINSKYLTFTTETIKTDNEAKEHLNKYIKRLNSSNYDVIICTGPMETNFFDFKEMQEGERKVLTREGPEDQYGHMHQHFHPASLFEKHQHSQEEKLGTSLSPTSTKEEVKETKWHCVKHRTEGFK